ncbi:BREX-1 system phosphatase PglZ type A [Microbacterium foliorum]|uniref:BREX-1 system phosphatase PglZ type A n=1 Tax=Microbacterium foliorum TaxID=104336 RepID=UPI003735DB3A
MPSADPLIRSLASRFEHGPNADGRHVAIWHDPAGDYADRLDAIAAEIGNVKVIRVEGDEFAVKHRLLVEERTQPFIVYRSGGVPPGLGNWLLDLEYAYGVFTADKAALVGEDLGLEDPAARSVVAEHPDFFNAADRRERLKKRLASDDNRIVVLAKMCAVLLRTEQHSLSELTRELLVEAARGEEFGLKQLTDFGLLEFYWTGVETTYGYASDAPTMDDFILWVFRSAYEGFPGDTCGRNIQIDYSRWRDSKSSGPAMAELAGKAEDSLQIAAGLETRSWEDLLDDDTFESIDRKILSDLAAGVAGKTISAREVVEADRRRHSTFWYSGYEPLYTAIRSASELLAAIDAFDPAMASFDDGLQKYASGWSKIDALYRHFVHAARSTEHTKPLEPLVEQVENFYSNKYVGPLATAWQAQVDSIGEWKATTVPSQQAFFTHYVAPLVAKGKRVVVIISDALRYEVADELATRLRRYKDSRSKVGFEASIDPILGALPSYTQLGMAALLPHTTIGFSGVRALTEVDGKKADGTANRSKILQSHGGMAIQAEDLAGYTVKELRSLTQQQQFMYVYHNRIDATGDKIGTERQVFNAAVSSIDELVKLTKQFASADVGAIFVTADHGFLFQDRELDPAGYLSAEPQGDEIHDRDRRRVIGRGLKADSAFRHFTPEQLGLSSDYEVLIPKGTKRLKLQGSGARYVHGGATLQEIVVPVISVTYTDSGKSTVRPVNIAIQQKSPNISTGVLAVDIHQSEPVTDKVQGREVRAGIYLGDELLSNHVLLKFISESNDPRERFVPARMALRSEADAHNNEDVELRLEEQIPNTTQWRIVTKAVYKLKRSFQMDF